MNTRLAASPLLLLLFAVVVAGCAGGAGAPAAPPSADPGASVGPSPSASLEVVGPVTTPEAAWAAVAATDPRYAAIGPLDPDLIGQSAWYEVMPASGVGAYMVTVTVGWGDCPAGCIERHTWQYAVAPDGTVTLQAEDGGAVPPDAWPTGGGSDEY
jgi:hypothetical protein